MSVLGALLGKRPEARSASDEGDWWGPLYDAWNQSRTAGVNVNSVEKALDISAYWRGVRLLAGTVGWLPCITYRRTDRGKERALKNPAYKLLHDRANPYLDAMTFQEVLVADAVTRGNGFAEIERSGAGKPVALWPLPQSACSVQIVAAQVKGYAGKLTRPAYLVTFRDRTQVTLDPDNVLHIKGLGSNGLWGYPVLHHMRTALGVAAAADQYGAAFFANGAEPGGVLTHPDSLSPEAKAQLKRSWEDMHKGVNRQHRVAVLEEGMKWEKVSITPEEAQMLETRQFQVLDFARFLGIPPHKLMDLSRATFSNIEHQNIEWVTDGLMYWLRKIEHEVNYKLFGAETSGRVFCEYLVTSLLRGDAKSRFEAYQKAIQSGWMTRNEARELENLNPLDGLDEPLQPLNMLPVSEVGEEPEDVQPGEPGEEDDAERFRDLFAATWRQIVTREVGAMRKLVGHPDHPTEDVVNWWRKHGEYIRKKLAPVLHAWTGNGHSADSRARDYATRQCSIVLSAAEADELDSLLQAWDNTKPEDMAGEMRRWGQGDDDGN